MIWDRTLLASMRRVHHPMLFLTARVVAACVLTAMLFPVPRCRAATSLTGSTGLIFVPVANVVPDASFAFGGLMTDYQGFPGKGFSYFRKDRPSFYFAGYLTLGYIPRVEITVRGNGMPSTVGPAGPSNDSFYTDGMLSIQALVWRGGDRVPSVAIGIQDSYGFMIFNALYTVFSWDVPISKGHHAQITAGWAFDWYSINQGTRDDGSYYGVHHVLSGPIAGVEYPVRQWASILVEFDSHALNTGARFRLANWCTLDLAAVRWGVESLARWEVRGFAAHLHFDGTL
jgi:hypothetical protein